MSEALDPDRPEPEQIAAYLRANPDFLAGRPDLYRVLTPPQRVHGEPLADHMTAMVRIERAHAAAQEDRAASVLAAGRAAAGLAERVHEAIVALIAARDIFECVEAELPHLLGVDAAALCCETFAPGWRSLPPGATAMLMRGRTVICRDRPADAVLLHAEAALLAERDVLVRLPCRAPALLALVSRDPAALPGLHASPAYALLGRVLAAVLSRAA
jgi:uncharacterized protein YigA (DUF484 family)